METMRFAPTCPSLVNTLKGGCPTLNLFVLLFRYHFALKLAGAQAGGLEGESPESRHVVDNCIYALVLFVSWVVVWVLCILISGYVPLLLHRRSQRLNASHIPADEMWQQEPLAAPMKADASTASIAFMASIDATASAAAASAELHEEQESAPWTPAAFTSDVAIDLDEAKEPTASPPVITTVAGVVLAAATQADTPTAVATIAELLYWKERAEDLERLLASIHENRAAPKTKHMACQTQRVPRKEVACQSRRIRMMNAECQSDPLPTPSSAPPLAPPLAPPPSAPICSICLTEEANVLCRPCVHIGMCQACGTNIAVRYCPVCRARIKKTESVYIC